MGSFGWVRAQAFSLDFNRRSHMRTHTGENYHVCPVLECGKKLAHESKLKGARGVGAREEAQDPPQAQARGRAPGGPAGGRQPWPQPGLEGGGAWGRSG